MTRKSKFKRIKELEAALGEDWIKRIPLDYLGNFQITPEWERVYRDGSVVVLRHTETGEIQGVFEDQRTDDEIVEQGGDLAFL